jgi:cation diffusion facilitator CzcD-associated flavoprotein CzcO
MDAKPEILDYLRKVASDHELEPHFRFRREMVSARWAGKSVGGDSGRRGGH